jgi:lysophospholipase L1-like esterase
MKRVYVIGDSISIHYGPYLKFYLNGVMKYSRKEGEDALLDLDNPLGANGGDSSMVLSYLKLKVALGIDADFLLVNCGLHDIKADPKSGAKQIPLEQYEENLRKIIQLVAKQAKPELIWIRSTPCDDVVHNRPNKTFYRFKADCDAYNDAADQIMAERKIRCIDLHTFTSNLGSNLFCDHVHFHPHIREKQAAFIAEWLSKASA